MDDIPLISVVMPAYRSARYLRESLESILRQTYRKLEILLIDDTPEDDGTQAILQELNDARIRYVKPEKRLGLVGSLNEGVRLARGTYIARMDADDISHVERLERQEAYLRAHPDVGVVGCACYLMDERGRVIGCRSYPTNDEEIKAKLLFNSAFIHPGLLIRKDLLMKFPYREGIACCEDYELWSRLMSVTHFYNLEEKLLKYRQWAQSAMEEQLKRLQTDEAYYREHTSVLRMAYDNALAYHGADGTALHPDYVDLLFAKKLDRFSLGEREAFLRQCREVLAEKCPERYLHQCIGYQWIKMAKIHFWQAKDKRMVADSLQEMASHAVHTARARFLQGRRVEREGCAWTLKDERPE